MTSVVIFPLSFEFFIFAKTFGSGISSRSESITMGNTIKSETVIKTEIRLVQLEKNKLLLQKRDQQEKLNSILEEEKKLENEQKFTTEKEQTTTIASQRKSLQESRQDLEKKIQEVEKKRWEAEKQIEDTDNKVSQIDKSSDQLVTEKNGLGDKILGVDKSLREIYSGVMTREEEKRRGQAQEQIAQREALSKARLEQKEKIQREQWSGKPAPENKAFLNNVPVPMKRKKARSFEAEEEQRKKFMQDVEQMAATDKNINTNKK